MLNTYEDVALSPELSVIMQKVIEIIDGFQKSKVIGISNVYNLFLNIKGFIPFDQANRQKLEYSTYELFFIDFAREFDELSVNECFKVTDYLQENSQDGYFLSDFDDLIDAFVQFLKYERLLYEDCMLLADSPFVKDYRKKRLIHYAACLTHIKFNVDEFDKYYAQLGQCEKELIELRSRKLQLYREIDIMIIIMEWMFKNYDLSENDYSISALYDKITSIPPDEDEQE